MLGRVEKLDEHAGKVCESMRFGVVQIEFVRRVRGSVESCFFFEIDQEMVEKTIASYESIKADVLSKKPAAVLENASKKIVKEDEKSVIDDAGEYR